MGVGALTAALTRQAPPAAQPFQLIVRVLRPAELILTIIARCDRCAWDTAGREAVMLSVSLDARYSQHVPLVRTGLADYRVLLGPVAAGGHAVAVAIDSDASAKDLRAAATVVDARVFPVSEGQPEHAPLALAPVLHARPNTIGRFSDVPVLMWYETEPTARGTRYRYTVIFTNEDGGTPADRLMATWGRTTDIEYIYSVEVDRTGAILAEDYQGPDHKVLPFRGRRHGSHPLLWVVTDNNMVRDAGATAIRYAPAPVAVVLKDESREAVMDANPWLYALMTQELAREGKVVHAAEPGTGAIPSPRTYLYLEACGEVGSAALAFAARVGGTWIPSDRGMTQYRIARDGCFRAAIPLPAGTGARDVRALRAIAYQRTASEGKTPPPAGPVRLTRINKVFLLDDGYKPGPSLLHWEGTETIRPGGEPFEIAIP